MPKNELIKQLQDNTFPLLVSNEYGPYITHLVTIVNAEQFLNACEEYTDIEQAEDIDDVIQDFITNYDFETDLSTYGLTIEE